jgi:CBS domain-containing protein
MSEGIEKIMDTHILYVKHDDLLEDALTEIKKNRPAAVIVNDKEGGFMGYFSPIDYIEAENKLKAIKKQ